MKKAMIILTGTIALAGMAWADRGSIPFNPSARVYEPRQRAMIAWNGHHEVLLLSTDLRASEPTKVLEVLPLPSKPRVEKGDIRVFRRANAMIRAKLRGGEAKRIPHPESGPPKSPSGEVTFHDTIGAHDISVTHVLDRSGFIAWVEDYLRRAGVNQPEIPDPLKEVVDEYIDEGFEWFVFDVVQLEEKPQTHDAILYRFATDSLFYPLKITRTEAGKTHIELLIVTRRLLSDFRWIPTSRVHLLHDPVTLSAHDLRRLGRRTDQLFRHQDGAKLRTWMISGKLASFTEDLVVR